MAISKEVLLKGRKHQEEVYLNDKDFVIVRSLTTGEILNLNKKYEKDEMLLTVNMIAMALVEPKLTADEVLELELEDMNKISNKILEFQGVNKEDIEKEVSSFRKK